MIKPYLFVQPAGDMGLGVFTSETIGANIIIEVSPVLIMSGEERKLLDQTALHDYIFEWGDGSAQCIVAWGYASLYNHAYESNCEYEMDYKAGLISIKTIRPIGSGEQLFVNYNGTYNNTASLWFDAK